MSRGIWLAALVAVACGGGEAAPPAKTAEPTPTQEATPEPEPKKPDDTMTGEATPPAEEPKEAGPPADKPGRSTTRELGRDRGGPPDGFYFVEGNVTRLPCNACAKPDCKPGEKCPPLKNCSFCNATVIIEDGGNDCAIDHPDRDNLPRYKLGERVRIVLERKKELLLYIKKSKPCPPSECSDTDPSKKLPKAPGGAEVRREDGKCFSGEGDEEKRVRCP
jgi:hypothetical protein